MSRRLNVLYLGLVAIVAVAAAATLPECLSPCKDNAFCDTSLEYPSCVCNPGFYGSGYVGCTSTPECTRNEDCADDMMCDTGYNLCSTPCATQCPQDVGCIVRNHTAECIYGGASIGHFD
ncbi:adhesion G protein-coupled receptor L4 [Anabrus simplex]|uniref:adhesion G protein-coupled receptor L4 n=1 Tax=Anabrus simplex TaxID=316456 RepID=UPI0035A2ABBF